MYFKVCTLDNKAASQQLEQTKEETGLENGSLLMRVIFFS